MTQDEIIQTAKKAGLEPMYGTLSKSNLERFAKLVEDKVRQEIIEKNAPVIKKVNEHIKELQDAVKSEREACAKIVEVEAMQYSEPVWAFEIVNDIRARGEA